MKIIYTIIILMFTLGLGAQPQWVHYTMSNSGLPSNSVWAILIDSNNVKWITSGNGFVRLKGNTWTVFDTTNSGMPSNGCGFVVKDKQNNLWITISNKGIAKFDGINWTEYNDENTGYSLHSITSISIDSSNNKWVGIGGGILKFNDTVWTRYHTGNSGIPSNGVLSVFCEGNIVWVGTYDEGVGRFDGQNWTTYNFYNSGLPSNWIYRMNKDVQNNIWFATLAGGAAKFNYLQNQWTVYNTGNSSIPSNYVSVVYIDNNNVKWIGTQEGCAIFNDTTWQVFPSSFIGAVRNFSKDKYGNMWICSANGLYVYNPNGVVGVENNTAETPSKYSLSQNYPNPFNPTTNIKFSIVNSGDVKVVVYDIQGREVQTLVNESLKPGTYEAAFDGSALNSGVYFYKLVTGNFTETKKMLLIK
jgi:ligand-binding sensor domain-containing protein